MTTQTISKIYIYITVPCKYKNHLIAESRFSSTKNIKYYGHWKQFKFSENRFYKKIPDFDYLKYFYSITTIEKRSITKFYR